MIISLKFKSLYLIMDVITISSESEDSSNEAEVTIIDASIVGFPEKPNKSFNVDWNDVGTDDDLPPINYSFEPPKYEGDEITDLEKEIENFITPKKTSEKKASVKLKISGDEETIPYDLPKVTSLTSDFEDLSQNQKLDKAKQRQKLSQEEKQQKKLEKERLKEEKKAEQQRQKILKAAFIENQRNLKPEENIKFLKVHIDNDIVNSAFGGNVISLLQEHNIQYVVESQRKNFTISWSKKRIEKVTDSCGELVENVRITDEDILLYVLDWKKAVKLIHSNELLSHIETVRSAYVEKKITVVVYGIKKYFNYKKQKMNNEMRALVRDNKKSRPKHGESVYDEAPDISKDQLEFAVTDLQLFGKHNCRFIETPDEFSSLLLNITRSLSQIDYKLEKQKRLKNFGWITTDSSHSVKVDKNGNGLLRLWLQQICQFNAVGMEAAQAVVSHYNSPLALMNAYEKSGSSKEAELLLQNIQIRREAGILSTSRRIGPQLSKKLYKFFTSDDADAEL